MTESQWDSKLNIQTVGRDGSHSDEYHHPYEPTPYSVLVRLAESGYITRENTVIDYGCGKGRVGFFLNQQLGCSTVGVEYDASLYGRAKENQFYYIGNPNISFVCASAENYPVGDADCFYFFNPFSEEILKAVLGRIMDSWYENPRELKLFFYYPSDEYVSYLMTADELVFQDEIDCRDLFAGNDPRERVLIFSTSGAVGE